MHATKAFFRAWEDLAAGLCAEIWPQYSAKAVFYVAQLRFPARLFAI
jgi:hypothetical protein